jgi:teichuronic acid biosynthesis glycosyltransferase TuaC
VIGDSSSIARRIAVISTSYPSDDDDSAGHFVRTEVERYLREGHEVTVFAPKARRQPTRARVIGITHLGAFGTPGAIARMRWRPDRWIGIFLFVLFTRKAMRQQGRFNSGVAHFLVPSFWPICSNFLVPLEIVVHGSDLRLVEKLPRFLGRLVLRGLANKGRTLRCVSKDLSRRISRLIDGKIPIRVEPSPIDVPADLSKLEMRKKLGVGKETLVVIVARLVRSKRIDIALAATRSLPDAKVVVCGEGPEHRRLKRAFPATTFLGHLPRRQVLEWIAASDLVLSASLNEGAPTAIREARALNVPVVTTAAGDLAKWAEADDGLWVVPELTRQAVAAALASAASLRLGASGCSPVTWSNSTSLPGSGLGVVSN